MSTDYAFWKDADPGADADAIFDTLAEGDASALGDSGDVRLFRQELLSRWPELIDYLEPPAGDGKDPDEGKYVLLTLGRSVLDVIPEVLEMARTFGLAGYSGMDEGLV